MLHEHMEQKCDFNIRILVFLTQSCKSLSIWSIEHFVILSLHTTMVDFYLDMIKIQL